MSPLADTPVDALRVAAAHAPYLARLADKESETLRRLDGTAPDQIWNEMISGLSDIGLETDQDDVMRHLRRAKRQAHLILAGADLSGLWPLSHVTQKMTEFADAATSAALTYSAHSFDLSLAGLFVIALGKMGAGELNYSSDIDVAAFFDPDLFDGGRRAPSDSARRIIQKMTRLLSDQTADGYVLRTDLRLRPDPSSTPVAVSTKMAELYYETVGQNWERMVWIKARPCAGDVRAADKFVDALSPFVWRQHLDYWAISDIHAIKRMINSNVNAPDLEAVDADLKLGIGGIREIEFFAQTQQLIMGGRDVSLQVRDTVSAIQTLQSTNLISEADADHMIRFYEVLRAVEHRVQMRQDEQTHALPRDEDQRADIAVLCGVSDLAAFDASLQLVRRKVHSIYLDLFGAEARGKTEAVSGNLVFTGVDPDPGTVKTLKSFGFNHPEQIIQSIAQWHRGHILATRSVRGREILTALLPGLLSDMSETGDPDEAFKRFQNFVERLPSGVQCLSMLLAEKDLRKDLVATLGLAPRLATILGRQPQLIEALLTSEQTVSLSALSEETFEDAMNQARRFVREAAVRIGHGLLHGHLAAGEAGTAYSDLADTTIAAMADAAERETERKFGSAPGDWCVVALGKLGGYALTAGSDLDLMVIYDMRDDTAGPVWFTRFTQRLITALSADTAEGQLYEVDMRLRPSGRSGPVAVRLSSFEKYHRDEAWTWEHMALTRLRPVCGNTDLSNKIRATSQRLLVEAPRRDELTEDILDMRRRLARQKPSQGLWDLKQGEGGVIDLEFIVQRELLMLNTADPPATRLSDAIKLLKQSERLSADEAADLLEAESVLSALQQIQRLALTQDIDPATISDGLKDRLARAVAASDFEEVEKDLRRVKFIVQNLRRKRIGDIEGEILVEL
ncbi:MAG: bifunctional [glutamine synthetase] adenylyltransferase/[glutamine synthetase]-adenylyl-L-tyrosine phosphorylase [Pseudomonadota bacterium]